MTRFTTSAIDPRPFHRFVQPAPSGCWEWTGHRDKRGYGRMHNALAHRKAYEAAKGPIPEGMFVCHSCDNPPCCNPSHLWIGTCADNTRDARDKGLLWQQRSHCRRGHEFTPENTKTKGRQRLCRACDRLRMDAHNARRRAARRECRA